jgi:hypothetical protein
MNFNLSIKRKLDRFLVMCPGWLAGMAIVQPAFASSFAFSRTYQGFDSNFFNLSGEFTGIDLNSDGKITAEEVISFTGTLEGIDKFTREEPKNISSFNYILGTNILEFNINTTGRTPPNPPQPNLGFESSWFVNFQTPNNSFVQTDIAYSGSDGNFTGKVVSVPESNNWSLLGILGLGLIGLRKVN